MKREPELQQFWAKERIYERLYEESKVYPGHSDARFASWTYGPAAPSILGCV